MSGQNLGHSGKQIIALTISVLILGLSGVGFAIEQLRFKPGFNLFSPKQDVQLGQEASAQTDKQLPLVSDPLVTDYTNSLGRRLVQVAPINSDYAWRFKVVNSRDINAFALPGGFIYVNRGALEAAEDEAQIAGVMAHESGHVVLRHGTHQASQMMLAQAPLSILGGVLGQSSSLTAQLAEMGIGFGVQSIFLKNSRSAESQADEVGTYILYHAGYDPHAMAQYFDIIQKKYPQRTLEFFSDHPDPGNRIKRVDEIIPLLGPDRGGKTDSPEFQAVKQRLLAMPPPPKGKPAPRAAASPPGPPPPAPSARLVKYQGHDFVIGYPDNWEVQSSKDSVTLAPHGAILAGEEGDSPQAYGASIIRFQPRAASRSGWGLVDATDELVDSMRQANPNLRVVKRGNLKISGQPALSTLLENDSPIEGQVERDHLVTVRAGEILLALIFIAPEPAVRAYQPAFDAMLRSFEVR